MRKTIAFIMMIFLFAGCNVIFERSDLNNKNKSDIERAIIDWDAEMFIFNCSPAIFETMERDDIVNEFERNKVILGQFKRFGRYSSFSSVEGCGNVEKRLEYTFEFELGKAIVILYIHSGSKIYRYSIEIEVEPI